MPSVQVPSVSKPPVFGCVLQALHQKGVHGMQSPHPKISSNALPQVQVVNSELQQEIAQSTLAQKTTEVARSASALQDNVANPTEVICLSGLLKTVGQKCTRLQAEFQKIYGPRTAVASEAASGATMLNDHANRSAAHVLPTDQTEQMLNGQHGAAGPNLDPSAAVFQQTDENLLGSIAVADPTGVPAVVGARPMTTQEYEAILDPNYIADRQ